MALLLSNSEIIAIIFGCLGFLISIVSILRTSVKGPIFVIPYVELQEDWNVKDNGTAYCAIKPLIQNIGDRMSYLIINQIELYAYVNDSIFKSIQTEGLPEQNPYQTQSQSPKRFTVVLPKKSKGWKYGFLIISGEYTNHKGKLKPCSFEYDLFPKTREKFFYLDHHYPESRKLTFTELLKKRPRSFFSQFSIEEIEPLNKEEFESVRKKIKKMLKKN